MSKAAKELAYRKSLTRYLKELGVLVHAPASAHAIGSEAELGLLRDAVKRLASCERRRFEIPFEEKEKERFASFIEKLRRLNSSPVYIWTNAANGCGLFKVSSLTEVNRKFPYDVNDEGIVVLLAADIRDRMIWDFSEIDGGRVLEVELIGESWPQAIY